MIIDATTEVWIRLGAFIGVLLIMLSWELARPNRRSAVSQPLRWSSNLVLVVLGSLTARLMLPTGLAAIAIWAQQQNIGLWNQFDSSLWLALPLTVVLFDCLIYWQHRIFHRIPWLWRVHRVHHADPHLDVSTGLRFHPLEIALSIIIKIVAVLALGAPVMAILVFEVLLNASSMFNHSNIKLPASVEKPLRKLIVTQAMHRIHHSQEVNETDSNFGFNLSIWDRLFGSYTAEAAYGDDKIKLGLKEFSNPTNHSYLIALLLMPFRNKPKPDSK